LDNTDALIDQMRALGLLVGLVLNPDTPFSAVAPYLDRIDSPARHERLSGFLVASRLSQMSSARSPRRGAAIDDGGYRVILEVRRRHRHDHAALLPDAGARIFVAGNAVFGTADPAAAIGAIRDVVLGAIG